MRASELENTLGLLKQELLDRELSLEELKGLCEKLSAELPGAPAAAGDGGRAAAAVGKQINELKQREREATRKLMALVSEVSMYQAEASKLAGEAAAAEAGHAAAQEAFDRGLAPSLQAEQRWSSLERARTLGAGGAGAEPPAGPEPRPNFYVPTPETGGLGGVGIPKPYGKNAPFKPSEAGASMRHFHAPVAKPIEL
jgi:hypothetical protein